MSIRLYRKRQTAQPRCLHISNACEIDVQQRYPDMPVVDCDHIPDEEENASLYEKALIMVNALFMAGHGKVLFIDTTLSPHDISCWQDHVENPLCWFDRIEIHQRHHV